MSVEKSLIRLPEVIQLTGLSRSSIYRLEQTGAFVSRVRLGKRATAWPLNQVMDWISSRPRACVRASNEDMNTNK